MDARTARLAASLTLAVALAALAHRACAQGAGTTSATSVATMLAACGPEYAGRSTGIVRGEVHDAESHPVGTVAVTVAWHMAPDLQVGASRRGAPIPQQTLGVLTDSAGHWQLCGAPLRTPLSIRAAADEGSAERIATLDEAHPVESLDLSLVPDAATGVMVHTTQTTALVVFSVQDRDGNALGGVMLDLAPVTGPVRRVVTDSAGRAIIPSVDPGRAKVNSLAIGYKPGELYVPLDAGRNTVPIILDGAHIPTLATIRVIGNREMLARHQEFEMRRTMRQTTRSITAEEIAERNPADTWQMLTNVPSMRVTQFGAAGSPGIYAISTRETPVVQRKGGGGVTMPCWYRVMVDGVLLQDPMPDLGQLLPKPGDVHGIEVFAGLATIPPQYAGPVIDGDGNQRSKSCGLIAVWTK